MNTKRFIRPNRITYKEISNLCEMEVSVTQVDTNNDISVSVVSQTIDFSSEADPKLFDLYRIVKTGNLENLKESVINADNLTYLEHFGNSVKSISATEKIYENNIKQQLS